MIKKYRKKSGVYEAMRYTGSNLEEIKEWAKSKGVEETGKIWFRGDAYMIIDEKGKSDFLSARLFHKLYEEMK